MHLLVHVYDTRARFVKIATLPNSWEKAAKLERNKGLYLRNLTPCSAVDIDVAKW